MVHLQELGQAQNGLKKQQRVISDARGVRMLHGMSQNLCLIERFIKPIEDYLRGSRTSTSSLLDWALAQNVGSVAQVMLPFFYQDWAGIKDFEEAETLITSALKEHRPDDETAAILGTGACGIAYASAQYFQKVYGVDLSVPTLLLAQAFLSGGALEIHLSQAGWQSVKVSPPAPSKNEIRLVAADVGTLPFAKGSLSAVVTQYLMDIVGDPLGIATEIQRVLKPNGIWVNFSNPFRLPEDSPEFPLPEPSELAELLKPCGLEMIKAERQRFTLLNLDPIYAGGHRKLQEVHFFVARKPHSQGIVTHRRFQIWDKHDGSWWEHIPKIIRGREIQIIQKKILGPEGIREQMEIGLNAVNFGVSREHTAFAEVLFSHIDGKHTLRDIQNHLASQGITMSETEFRELIYCLLNQYCVISLDHSVVA